MREGFSIFKSVHLCMREVSCSIPKHILISSLLVAILNTKVHKSQICVLRVFGTCRCYSMLSRRLCCSLVKLSKLFPPKKQSRSRPLLTHITLGVFFGVVSFGRAHELFESHMPMPTMHFIVHLIILQLMALGPHR